MCNRSITFFDRKFQYERVVCELKGLIVVYCGSYQFVHEL